MKFPVLILHMLDPTPRIQSKHRDQDGGLADTDAYEVVRMQMQIQNQLKMPNLKVWRFCV